MEQYYCDANIFLGWFNQEPDKVEACRGLVQASKEKKVQVVTSAITLTEVIKIKGQQRLEREKEDIIRGFFEQPSISIVNVDRTLAEFARQLIWEHFFLDHKDSIHVATALKVGVEALYSFDNDLLKLSGRLGQPPLRICLPDLPYQTELSL